MDSKILELLRRQILLHIHSVFCGKNDRRNAGALGGKHFFFNASDGKYVATERDLAGHCGQGPNAMTGKERHQRGRHGNPSRGTILWNRARHTCMWISWSAKNSSL